MARRKDEHNLFHRTLPANAGGPSSPAAVACHLKFKHIEHFFSLTKNYCISQHVKNKLSS